MGAICEDLDRDAADVGPCPAPDVVSCGRGAVSVRFRALETDPGNPYGTRVFKVGATGFEPVTSAV